MTAQRAWLDDDRVQVSDEATQEIRLFGTLEEAAIWVEAQPFPGLTGHYQSSGGGPPTGIVWVDSAGTRRFVAYCRRGV